MNTMMRLLVVAVVPAALPAQSLWSRVPAAPASCYFDQAFSDAVAKAKEQLDTEMHRQDSVNDSLSQIFATEDRSVKMAAMQASMAKDPAGAQKMMQGISNMSSAAAQSEKMQILKRQEDLEAEFPGIESSFKADYDRTMAPVFADWQKRAGGEGSKMPTPAETAAMRKQFNDAYAPVCAQYFQAGKFPKWLASYKEFYEKEYIPGNEKAFTAARDMLVFYGVNGTNYKSTVTMKAVSNYLGFMYRVYSARTPEPAIK